MTALRSSRLVHLRVIELLEDTTKSIQESLISVEDICIYHPALCASVRARLQPHPCVCASIRARLPPHP